MTQHFKCVPDPKTGKDIIVPLTEEELEDRINFNLAMECACYSDSQQLPEYRKYSKNEVEEFKRKIVEHKWNAFRENRNKLLAKSDILMMPDLWEGYTEKKKKEVIKYRQALRDLPTTITDIDNVIYPEKP